MLSESRAVVLGSANAPLGNCLLALHRFQSHLGFKLWAVLPLLFWHVPLLLHSNPSREVCVFRSGTPT